MIKLYILTVGFSPILYSWTLRYYLWETHLNLMKSFRPYSLRSHLDVLTFSPLDYLVDAQKVEMRSVFSGLESRQTVAIPNQCY